MFANPAWTVQQFDAEADIARAEAMDDNVVNALESESEAVSRTRRKADSVPRLERSADLSWRAACRYYTRAVEASGGAAKVNSSYRLFLAPGMGHCGGGEGPNTFDMVSALEQWVEDGTAPDRIEASHATAGRVDRTRPLCPYPQVAVYKGSGSIDQAASFACRTEWQPGEASMHRILCVGFLIVAAASISAQSSAPTAPAAPAAKKWTVPRTPDGHPDLQGIWTTRTFTPLVRPARYANQEFLTDKEAAELSALLAGDDVDPLAAGIFGASDEERRKRVVQNDPTHYDNAFWLATPDLKPLSSNRTSLIYDPPDGKIPAVDGGGDRSAPRRGEPPPASTATRTVRCRSDASSGRTKVRRCCRRPTTTCCRIIQLPDYVLVHRELATAPRV